MSAPRAARSALKAARTPAAKSTAAPKQTSKPLPKRANPHLVTLTNSPYPLPSQTRISPRALTIFGVGALGISTYCGYLYASYKREVKEAQALSIPEDVSDRYNHTARTFDGDVEVSEKLMRLGAKRRDLLSNARGDVLEVSCGTGRNLKYYDFDERRGLDAKGIPGIRGCRSVTFVDLSPEMVEIARGKSEKLHPELAKSGRVEFLTMDARDVPAPEKSKSTSSSLPLSLSLLQSQGRGYYDTIVQTMGLCSMPDPAGALKHLGTITEPHDGRILLLEHGRSHYDWLNRVLDNLAPAHADRHGCWWNRDIGQIVRDSGLEVVEEQRWHFGTTWRYVLRPKRP
ncbi:methyltransferase domain-containing protein [Aspergillus crustosus]